MSEPRPSRRTPSLRGLTTLAAFFAVITFLLYWVIAHQLNGNTSASRLPAPIETLISDYPLFDPIIPIINFAVGMFTPTVLLHLIALAFGYYIAHEFIIELVQKLYDLPDTNQAQRLFTRLRVPPGPQSKAVPLNHRTFWDNRADEPLLSIGGPGYVNISEGDVAVTEVNGRFERVVGFGRRKLRRFERVVNVLSLHEQESRRTKVELITQEGFVLTTDVHIRFKIKLRPATRDERSGFEIDDDNVRKAAYSQFVTNRSVTRWTSLPLRYAVETLTAIFAQKNLEQLINKDNELAPQPAVQAQLRESVEKRLEEIGLELIDVRYVGLRASDSVEAALLELWQKYDKPLAMVQEAPQPSEADKSEAARQRSRAKMLQSLTAGLEKVRERQLRELEQSALATPLDDEQRLITQFAEVMQVLGGASANAPKQPADQLRLLRRNRVNHLVWQLIDELDSALQRSAFMSDAQRLVLIRSQRLRLRMREAVTFQAKPAVGSALQLANYRLPEANRLAAERDMTSFDTLVIEAGELDILAQQLLKEASVSAMEELNLAADSVDFNRSAELRTLFRETIEQFFVSAPRQDRSLPRNNRSLPA